MPGRKWPPNSLSADMLEATALFLSHTDGPVRPIVADTGALVGSARLSALGMWAWLGGTVVEVRETDDEPLLFTIRRCWGLWPTYEVRDADGIRVGSVRGKKAYNVHGLLLGRLRSGKDWEGESGATLAEVEQTVKSTGIRFIDAKDSSPFVRMVLLAAMLILYR